MEILGGASGGPVFFEGNVIGINSTSLDLTAPPPVSFIFDIRVALDIELKEVILPCGSYKESCKIRDFLELNNKSLMQA